MKTKIFVMLTLCAALLFCAAASSCGVKTNDYVGSSGETVYIKGNSAASTDAAETTVDPAHTTYNKYFEVAVEETKDGILYLPYTDEDGNETSDIIIVGYSGPSLNVKIPSIIAGGNVRYIGEGAFYGKGNIVTIEIPDSVIEIGASAFSSCPNLTSVTLGKNLKEIPYAAFRNCRVLSSVTLSEGLVSIDDFAFEGCIRLETLAIPSSVTNIGYDAFMTCERLTLDVSKNDYAAAYAADNKVNTSEFMSYSSRRLRIALCIGAGIIVAGAAVAIPLYFKKKRENIL